MTMSVVLASGADLHKEVLYTQVRVRCDAVGGSGTVIYSEKVGNFFDTYILTCHHVVEGAVKVETKWDSVLKKDRKVEISIPVIVEFFNWGSVPHGQSPLTSGAQASIVAYDQDDDVAILYLKLALRPAVAKTLPRESIEKMLVGRSVYAVGCALLNDPILTNGLLTHMGSIIDSRDYWMSSAAIIFGNCLPGDSMISMADGSVRPIKDIHRGDRVWSASPSGLSQQTVQEAIASGEKEIYEVKLRTRTLRASGNHPVLLVSPGKDWQGRIMNLPVWSEVGKLNQGDVVAVMDALPDRSRVSGLRLNDFIPQGKDPNDLMELLGFFVGDGWVRNRVNVGGYEVGLAAYDPQLAAKYKGILEDLFGVNVRLENNGNVVAASSKALVEKLIALGIADKSAKRDLPDWIMTAPQEYQMSFIRGYLEADGHVNSIGAWAFEAASERLIRKLHMMFHHLGIHTGQIYYRERATNFSKNAKSWCFHAYPALVKSRNSHIPGDQSTLPQHLNYEVVADINSVGKEPTYDLKLDGMHNFFAEGVLVHNSGGAMFTELDGAFYFLGIPSRISVTYGGQAITHLGYFSPISRIYKFMEMQIFDFLVPGSKRTPADCEKERKDKRERAKMMPDIPVEQNSGKAGRHSGFSDDDERYDAFRNGR